MRILALDLGTTMGYAAGDATGVCDAGVWRFSVRPRTGPGDRYLLFARQLDRTSRGVALVVWEEVVRHPDRCGAEVGHVFGGFRAVLMGGCEARKIPYIGVNVKTIKLHATGRGNANKIKMLDAARSKWGPGVADDNEADARWLLDYAAGRAGALLAQAGERRRVYEVRDV